MTDLINSVCGWVDGAVRIVVLTGAGISTESGIPDFRGPQGVWTTNPKAERLSNIHHYMSDPDVRRLAWQGRLDHPAWRAAPNAGHRALVDLERRGTLHALVTQNIDGLHQRAGSSDVIELHGTMHRFACLHRAHGGYTLDDLAGQDERPPRCPECGDLIRPDVVWFGEALPEDELRRAQLLAGSCDAMLVVGTSAVVFPAAALPLQALEAGAVVIDVNPEPGALTPKATISLRGRGGDILPQLIEELRARA